MFTPETYEKAAALIAADLAFYPLEQLPDGLQTMLRHAATSVLDSISGAVTATVAEVGFKLATAEGEIQNLRLAILGGEDAPGVAMSLTLEEVIDAHRANFGGLVSEAETARREAFDSSARADRLAAALGRLISDAEGQLCAHEETERGGTIWTICKQCGAKWADDQGGFPGYQRPAYIERAEAELLACSAPATAATVMDWSSPVLEDAAQPARVTLHDNGRTVRRGPPWGW
jgi:hypothetical protein